MKSIKSNKNGRKRPNKNTVQYDPQWLRSVERKRLIDLENSVRPYAGTNLRSEFPKQSSLVKTLSSLVSNLDMNKPLESSGEALGRRLGSYAGRLLGRITGSGDYSVDLPSGGATIESATVPEFIKTDNLRETRIRHREYLGDISASSVAGLFTNSSYRLNPGSLKTFPWLSTVAQQFEQWEPHGMAIIFKTLTSTYAASQSLGTVILATDYDVSDPSYTNKIEMDNSEFAVSGNAASNLLHPIECKSTERVTKLLFVESDASVTPESKRWADLGNLQIASSGCLANQLLGEIWITYDISFYKPQIGNFGSTIPCTGWYSSAQTTTTDIFGTTGIINFNGSSSLDIYPVGSNTLSFHTSYVGKEFLITVVNQCGGVYTQSLAVQNTAASNGVIIRSFGTPNTTPITGGGYGSDAVWFFVAKCVAPTASGRLLLVFDALSVNCNWTPGITCYITEVNPHYVDVSI